MFPKTRRTWYLKGAKFYSLNFPPQWHFKIQRVTENCQLTHCSPSRPLPNKYWANRQKSGWRSVEWIRLKFPRNLRCTAVAPSLVLQRFSNCGTSDLDFRLPRSSSAAGLTLVLKKVTAFMHLRERQSVEALLIKQSCRKNNRFSAIFSYAGKHLAKCVCVFTLNCGEFLLARKMTLCGCIKYCRSLGFQKRLI